MKRYLYQMSINETSYYIKWVIIPNGIIPIGIYEMVIIPKINISNVVEPFSSNTKNDCSFSKNNA